MMLKKQFVAENRLRNKEDAVSAPVGAMILLGITVVAAAVIISFTAGFVTVSEPVPDVVLSVYSAGSGDSFRLVFDHLSGETLTPSEIRITTLAKPAEGEEIVSSFMLSELSAASGWINGDIFSTGDCSTTASYLNFNNCSSLKSAVMRSVPLTVKIYHQPSSALIYTNTILLEEKS